MQRILWKKGFVLGIIFLFVGASIIPTVTINVYADDNDDYSILWQVDLPKVS